MSIFFDSIEKQVKKLDEHFSYLQKDEKLIAGYLRDGIQCVEVDDVEAFGKKAEEYLSPSYNSFDDFFKTQHGRPVIRRNIKSFKKNDVIGSLYALSKMPKTPKPVVIIENITEIPVGDDSIYDDPKLVENLMLHNWKNESSVFDDHKFGHFELRPADYSILITWSASTAEKMNALWRASDGLAWCGNFNRELEKKQEQ